VIVDADSIAAAAYAAPGSGETRALERPLGHSRKSGEVLPRSAGSLDLGDRDERSLWVSTLVSNLADADSRDDEHHIHSTTVSIRHTFADLREFLAYSAVDTSYPPRVSMRVLTDVYTRLVQLSRPRQSGGIDGDIVDSRRELHAVRDLLDVLVESFPDPLDGARLKRALFGGSDKASSAVASIPEASALAALATTPLAGSAFTSADLSLHDRARRLWSSDGGRSARWVLHVLKEGGATALGEEVLVGLAKGVPAADVINVAEDFPGLLYQIVLCRPQVATAPDLWRAPPALRREAATALALLRRQDGSASTSPRSSDDEQIASITAPVVRAVLEASVSAEAERLTASDIDLPVAIAHALGPLTIHAYLDLVQYQHLALGDAVGWRQALRADVRAGREWFFSCLTPPHREARLPALAALAQTLDPRELQTPGGLASGLWTRLGRELVDGEGRRCLPEVARLDALTFVLAAALDDLEPTAAQQLSVAFPPVHAAAWEARLSSHAWALLDARLPVAKRGREWDHAERLREALIRAFARQGWEVTWFVRALGDGDALPYTVQRCTETEWGMRLLRSAYDLMSAGVVEGTPRQCQLFEAAVRERPPGLLDFFSGLFQ
jgi:hypothetical protein